VAKSRRDDPGDAHSGRQPGATACMAGHRTNPTVTWISGSPNFHLPFALLTGTLQCRGDTIGMVKSAYTVTRDFSA
jgi:hypothetical protein